MIPTIIKGGQHRDERGEINYNNTFIATNVKRIYTIENAVGKPIRGWQGHKIEQRWFSAIKGQFIIKLIKIDQAENTSKDLNSESFKLTANGLDILHVPAGYMSCIESLEEGSKLLVMADYELGEINDEIRYPLEYFNNI